MATIIDGTTGSSIAGNATVVGDLSVSGGDIVLSGSTSGTITVSAPSVAGSNTQTLPAQTGTITVSGPAFSAYRTAARNTAATNFQAVIPDTEEFDTASCYDTTTGRFTPNVAGYYQINGEVYSSASVGELIAVFYKNGTLYKYGTRTASGGNGASVSSVVFLNGTTDYVELYVYYSASPAVALNVGANHINYMNGVFVRPA
jgi:hypothetical protein